MNITLDGQVAIVTGASSGIGLGIAAALADAGGCHGQLQQPCRAGAEARRPDPLRPRATLQKQRLKLIPYGRIGAAEDIARAVLWLVSDAADYVVGTSLFVDGGMCLYPGFEDNG